MSFNERPLQMIQMERETPQEGPANSPSQLEVLRLAARARQAAERTVADAVRENALKSAEIEEKVRLLRAAVDATVQSMLRQADTESELRLDRARRWADELHDLADVALFEATSANNPLLRRRGMHLVQPVAQDEDGSDDTSVPTPFPVRPTLEADAAEQIATQPVAEVNMPTFGGTADFVGAADLIARPLLLAPDPCCRPGLRGRVRR